MNTTTGIQSVNCLILAVCQSVVAIISVIANGLLLIVLYKNPFKTFRRPFSILIIGLAITDFLKGFIADSISAWLLYHCALGKDSWLDKDWNFYTVLDYALDNSATILVVLFSCDRLLAVSSPFIYRNYATSKRTCIVVLSVWVYALFFSSLQFSGMRDESYDLMDSTLHIFVPLLLMITVHVCIFHVLKTRRRKIETSAYSTTSNQETPRWVLKNQQRDQNFRYVTAAITLALAISQLPWLSLVIIDMSSDSHKGSTWYQNYNLFAGFLLSITSAINPVLYCWRLKEYRRAVCAILACKKMPNSTTGLDSTRNDEDVVDLHAKSEYKDTNQQDAQV